MPLTELARAARRYGPCRLWNWLVPLTTGFLGHLESETDVFFLLTGKKFNLETEVQLVRSRYFI